MKCPKCEQVKPDYHFFSFRGNYIKDFFANPQALNGQCFDCNGPYKCICCGVVQESTQFRVNGRICDTCKNAGIYRPSRLTDAFTGSFAYEDSLDAENSAEMGA
jgi:hypothetical protein